MYPFQIQLGLQSPDLYAIIFVFLLLMLPAIILLAFIKVLFFKGGGR